MPSPKRTSISLQTSFVVACHVPCSDTAWLRQCDVGILPTYKTDCSRRLTSHSSHHLVTAWQLLFLLLVCMSWTITGLSQPVNSVLSCFWAAEYSRYKPPFSFVRGQDSTMRDIVSVSGLAARRQISDWSEVKSLFPSTGTAVPCSVRKWFST